MENKPFEFADTETWSDERLKRRLLHLGEHILIVAEHSKRHEDISREIGHLVFEMSNRNILAVEE